MIEHLSILFRKTPKGEKGQYFTPRHVIDMCVKMLNPQPAETIIDSASGSCGFLLHAIQYVWKNYLTKEKFDDDYKLERTQYANTKLYRIDYDPRSIKIGKALMLIAGDGKTNINFANSLDGESWNEETRPKLKNYLLNQNDFEMARENKEKMLWFNFDIALTNPPFAGDVQGSVLTRYDLAFKTNKKGKKTNKTQTKMSRDILFIERNLNFLKPGGRMAIVLPQGRFNNTSDKAIREYIAEKAKFWR